MLPVEPNILSIVNQLPDVSAIHSQLLVTVQVCVEEPLNILMGDEAIISVVTPLYECVTEKMVSITGSVSGVIVVSSVIACRSVASLLSLGLVEATRRSISLRSVALRSSIRLSCLRSLLHRLCLLGSLCRPLLGSLGRRLLLC